MVENRYFYGKSEPHVCITISYFKSFVKGRKARSASGSSAKCEGGWRSFDAGEKLCHSPSRKSGLHAARCHDVPCYVLAPGLTLLFLSHHLIEPSERKSDDIVIGAFYTRNKDRALALDAVRAGFIHRLTGGDVAIDLRSR